MGRNLDIITGELYLLLLGVTALSLLMTPGIIAVAKQLFYRNHHYHKSDDIEEEKLPVVVQKDDVNFSTVGKSI